MKGFLVKNWLMLALPLLVVAAAVVAFLVLGGGEDPAESFRYGM